MSFEIDASSADEELVFGLVAPLGVDLDAFVATMIQVATQFSYATQEVKVTDLIVHLEHGAKAFLGESKISSSGVERKIAIGNFLRKRSNMKDLFARFAVDQIRQKANRSVNSVTRRRLFIVNQLKRPEEIELLRQTYGKSFFLIGVHSPEESRKTNIVRNRNLTSEKAHELILRDADERGDKAFGQQTSDTFQLADFFVSENGCATEIERFLDLIFGAPSAAPLPEEYYMFLAFSSSLRSADMARQVGAVIVSKDRDVIATGANDVPKFGGGQYWPGPDDRRDYKRGFDANTRRRNEIVRRISDSLELLDPSLSAQRKEVTEILQKSEIKDLIEFMRPVHAEMEALMSCARAAVSTLGARLFCTTFPCHNCAKHLVSAGVSEVFYVEPYAKSLADHLHSDSIRVDDSGAQISSHLVFRPFNGVGPRRFMDLFSMNLSSGRPLVRKDDKTGDLQNYSRPIATHRFCLRRPFQSALELDQIGEFAKWLKLVEDPATLAPTGSDNRGNSPRDK